MKTSEQDKRNKVEKYVRENPGMPVSVIAANTGVKKSDVRKFLNPDTAAEIVPGREEAPEKEVKMVCSAEDIREKLHIPSAKLELLVLLGMEDGELEGYEETEKGQLFSAKALLYVFAKSQCTEYDALTELLANAVSSEKEEKIAMLEKQNASLAEEGTLLRERAETAENALAEEREKVRSLFRTIDMVREIIGPAQDSPAAEKAIARAKVKVRQAESEKWVSITEYCTLHPDITPSIVRDRIHKNRIRFRKTDAGIYLIPESEEITKYQIDSDYLSLLEKGWMTTTEVASKYGLDRNFVLRRCKKGVFTAVSTKEGWMIDPESLTAEAVRKMKSGRKRLPDRESSVPQLTEEEKSFKESATARLREKSNGIGLPMNSVLHIVYRVMRDKYGYVFEQMKKDYRYKWGLDENEKLSTFYVIVAGGDEKCRSIFMSVLNDAENYIGTQGTGAAAV